VVSAYAESIVQSQSWFRSCNTNHTRYNYIFCHSPTSGEGRHTQNNALSSSDGPPVVTLRASTLTSAFLWRSSEVVDWRIPRHDRTWFLSVTTLPRFLQRRGRTSTTSRCRTLPSRVLVSSDDVTVDSPVSTTWRLRSPVTVPAATIAAILGLSVRFPDGSVRSTEGAVTIDCLGASTCRLSDLGDSYVVVTLGTEDVRLYELLSTVMTLTP
jgi:hypothetical protein